MVWGPAGGWRLPPAVAASIQNPASSSRKKNGRVRRRTRPFTQHSPPQPADSPKAGRRKASRSIAGLPLFLVQALEGRERPEPPRSALGRGAGLLDLRLDIFRGRRGSKGRARARRRAVDRVAAGRRLAIASRLAVAMMSEQRAVMPLLARVAGRRRSTTAAAAQGTGHDRTATPTAAVSAPAASATATAPTRVPATATAARAITSARAASAARIAAAAVAAVGIMAMQAAGAGLITVPNAGATGGRIDLRAARAVAAAAASRNITTQTGHGAGRLTPEVPQAGKSGRLRPDLGLDRLRRPERSTRAPAQPHKPRAKLFASSVSPSPVVLSHAVALDVFAAPPVVTLKVKTRSHCTWTGYHGGYRRSATS